MKHLIVMLALAVCANAQGIPAGTQKAVLLTWQAPSPVGGSGVVKGYNIYRTPSGPPNYMKLNTALISGLTTTDNGVAAGSTYGYCATTVDTNDSESACTIPVNVGVPANPNAPSQLSATPR